MDTNVSTEKEPVRSARWAWRSAILIALTASSACGRVRAPHAPNHSTGGVEGLNAVRPKDIPVGTGWPAGTTRQTNTEPNEASAHPSFAASSDCAETKGPYDGVVAECTYAAGYSFLVLLLDQPIDVRTGHLDAAGHMPANHCTRGVKAMQLVANELSSAVLGGVLGKHVRFPAGDPFEAWTRYHNTRILFDPEELGEVEPSSPREQVWSDVRDDFMVGPCRGWSP
jgi:hypothetical protein